MAEVNRDGIIFGKHAPVKKELAVRMRRVMTPAEGLLWERLRGNKLGGLHFRRQQVVDGLIVDFYCHTAALVVEADGPVHETQQEHDEDRDAILQVRGLLVLRFKNEQIENDITAVLTTIAIVAEERIATLNTNG